MPVSVDFTFLSPLCIKSPVKWLNALNALTIVKLYTLLYRQIFCEQMYRSNSRALDPTTAIYRGSPKWLNPCYVLHSSV